ncbi:hypothetical protein J6X15_01990 [Candidatus Saccharibacteria bacterium]|nr:hypothetical protein [Candidatus Saccharibacteria bacterium]
MEQKKKHSELEANISLGAAIIAISGVVIGFILSLMEEGALKEFFSAVFFPLYFLLPLASVVAIVSGVLGLKDGQSRKKTGLGIAGGALSIVLNMLLIFWGASRIAFLLHSVIVWGA